MNKLKKAVFPVAGFGTRFLPATKAMPKELLPIVDKPLIQYAAEEAIACWYRHPDFCDGPKLSVRLKIHFDANNELETMLRAKGKDCSKADMVRNIIPAGVECIFVRQAEQLGWATPYYVRNVPVGGIPLPFY
jgi:UTP--glucose-1-phosphate uridylyltransferase